MTGSLNSMTYLNPKGFINKIKALFKTRHTANIAVQYEIYGVRTFDFHIDFSKSGKAYFKYEGVAYETFSVYSILNYLNKKKGVQVRLVLEGEGKEERFCKYCSVLEKIYTNINFFGGYVENTKRQIYAFKHTLLFPKIDWVKKLR